MEKRVSRTEQAIPCARECSYYRGVIVKRVQSLRSFSNGSDETLSQRAEHRALGKSNRVTAERTLVTYFRSYEPSKFVKMTGRCVQGVEPAEFSWDAMAIVIIVG